MSQYTKNDIVHSLGVTHRNLNAVIRMIDKGSPPLEIMHKSNCVQHTLKIISRMILLHHLNYCIFAKGKKFSHKELINEILLAFKYSQRYNLHS